MAQPKIYIALPLMAESEYLPALLKALRRQSYQDFQVIACVNQPEAWWGDPVRKSVCLDNRETLSILQKEKSLRLQVLDHTSKGRGWDAKDFGVGWARKTAMDEAAKNADGQDVILCLDGDTVFSEHYLTAVLGAFRETGGIAGLAIPYYHPLTGKEPEDRSVLRYEIYMRHYLLNLFRINSPYAFTAIGSAMAVTVSNYKRIKGLTPFKSGEDFYFMQKLAKSGRIGIYCDEAVYPAARFSNRVFFGTGPAMIKGHAGDWSSYPIYPARGFDRVGETYASFPSLFDMEVTTPMDEFLAAKFKSHRFWQPLRDNFKSREQFVKACQRKVDALRILQFLKATQQSGRDEDNFRDFMIKNFPERLSIDNIDLDGFDFAGSSLQNLDKVRDLLYSLEMEQRGMRRVAGIA